MKYSANLRVTVSVGEGAINIQHELIKKDELIEFSLLPLTTELLFGLCEVMCKHFFRRVVLSYLNCPIS